MKRNFKITIALLCLGLMLVGSLAPIAVALSGNVEGITNPVAAPEHELSVMSFNILDTVDDVNYLPPSERAPLAVKTIVKFMPDIVGIQEAGDYTYAGDFDWNDYLVEKLAAYGYACRYLTQEPVHPANMTIGAGLMIFYKKDRFDLIDHNSAQYTTKGYNGVYAAYQGFTRTDGSRYYHYVKLWDKEQETYLFTFNTHLAVPPSSLKQNGKEATAEQRTMLANIIRTQSARQLADAMEKIAGDYPCFSTGDYNASWSRSIKDDANSSQLYELTKNGIFSAAANDAYSAVSVTPNTIIDHVFYNVFHADALTYRGIHEEYGGWQPSDHMAMIGYFNLTTPITFASGSYDARSHTFTDSTDQDIYTFCLSELHEALSYKIFDKNGQQVADTVDLPDTNNRFTIQFYNSVAGKGTPFATVDATVYCTANSPAEISVPSARNVYFANGGWHVVLNENVTSLTPACANGIFYSDAAAQKQLPLPIELTADVTKCWLRTDNDEIFPVTIHRENAKPEEGKVLYVDDDIGDANGTVAFTTDDRVILAESGVNAFGSLAAAAAVANSADGYTVCVAPGYYKGNTVTFTKHVTLLGNNHEISPLVRADSGWSLATDRQSESVLDQQLNFSRSSVNFTVRGFTFVGSGTHAHAIQQTHSNHNNLVYPNVEKNIFRFTGNNTTNSSCIMLNTASKKMGRIADNYFEQIDDRPETLCRVITARNPYGIVFEENYCVNFTDQLSFISAETYHQVTEDPCNLNIVFRYNRFDNCVALNLYGQCVDSRGHVDIQLQYNDFVACGNSDTTYAVRIFCSSADSYVTDYSKFNINIFGNRFIGCRRSIYISRGSDEGDITQAHIRINRNRFFGMRQGITALLHLSFNVYRDDQLNATSPNWDFSHNYFTSDTVTGHHPDQFVSSAVTYNSESVNSVNSSLFLPYYTNADLTWLSEGVIKNQTGIKITENTHSYDGNPHSLTISAGEDAVISYSTDPDANRFYTAEKPTLTTPGTLRVYYQVERMGYTNFYGQALITVRVPNRTLTMENVTLPYDGRSHSLTPVYEPIEGDQISYVYNGDSLPDMPVFVNAGSYTVTMTVTNPYARDITATATLTITAGEITGVGLTVDDDIHVSGLKEGDSVLYSVNSGAFTSQKPVLTGQEQNVAVTVSRKGCNDLVLMTCPQTGAHPFTLQLTKLTEGEKVLWKMSITTDTQMLRQSNVTPLAYGCVTAQTAEQILKGDGTYTAVQQNETGILCLEEQIELSADGAMPTAAYVIFNQDGRLFTVYSPVGVK